MDPIFNSLAAFVYAKAQSTYQLLSRNVELVWDIIDSLLCGHKTCLWKFNGWRCDYCMLPLSHGKPSASEVRNKQAKLPEAMPVQEVKPVQEAKPVQEENPFEVVVASAHPTSAREQEVDSGEFYLHKRKIAMHSYIDEVPVTSNLHINVKTKNKNPEILLKEVWIDGKRVYEASKQ